MSASWDALPQRRRKTRAAASIEAEDNSATASSTASSSDIVTQSPAVQSLSSGDANSSDLGKRNLAKVQENIEARKLIKRATATLEGLDGCAGEFYEYLDHTADVQFHVWGSSLSDAFATMAPCMFNFITDLTTVEINPASSITFECTGHDMYSLLFNYMDEMLFRFCTDGFCCKEVKILNFSRETFSFSATAHGESFDPTKHPQGTEIKAITYSNMQIHEKEDRSDLFVIVDI